MAQRGQSRPGPSVRARAALAAGALGTGALLLGHAHFYRFLTDDAYIAFRYARNLAQGAGLVFNPGFERVEGYTDFLWVVMLAALHKVGAGLEGSSLFLSLTATVGLWLVVIWFAWRTHARRSWLPVVLVPPLLLAATRSIAVWSTGGMETRLFELLALGGALRLIVEVEALARGDAPRPVGALLLALATLTRPDGLLLAGAAAAALLLCDARTIRRRPLWLASSLAIFTVLIGGHFLFRHAYYGAWLPNTYYAKVGGRTWWPMGWRYLGVFALEYGVWLWVPFLVAGVLWFKERGMVRIPVVFGTMVLAHALYVASVGGDHFEYRPLDLAFPFLYLTIGAGAARWARGTRSRLAVAAGIGVVLVMIIEIPAQSHRQFPAAYTPGFPGGITEKTNPNYQARRPEVDPRMAEDFLDPSRSPIYRLPGLDAIGRMHRALLRTTTARFVGVRQEEHRLFLELSTAEGKSLLGLVARGTLPGDTYIATDCVGAIPYFSGLRVLDRCGLTDARVARGPLVSDIMAHGKHASEADARGRGVDLWAADNVFFTWSLADPGLPRNLLDASPPYPEAHFADLGEGNFLLVRLPRGMARESARFPVLHFRSTHDTAAVGRVLSAAAEVQMRLEAGGGH